MARGGICGVGNGRKAMLAEGGGQRGAFPLTHLRVAQACGARARGLGHITPSASVFLCRWDLTLMYKNHTSVVPDSVFFFFLNSGSGSEIQFLSEAQDDPQKRKPDIKKAKLMLGWEPVVRGGRDYRRLWRRPFPMFILHGHCRVGQPWQGPLQACVLPPPLRVVTWTLGASAIEGLTSLASLGKPH